MHLPFTQNHISYDAQDKVKKILAPLTKAANITYMDFGVGYNDNRCFVLHTHAPFFESWFTTEKPLCEYFLDDGWYLWDSFDDCHKPFDLGNGICHVQRFEDRTEIIAFATTPDNLEVTNFYLNNMHLLLKFKYHFMEEARELIDIANTQLITPHSAMTNVPRRFSGGLSHNLEDFDPALIKRLSPREYECYSLLIRGYTLAAMSKETQLAVPTLANYISRLKDKLGFDGKDQLLKIAESAGHLQYL